MKSSVPVVLAFLASALLTIFASPSLTAQPDPQDSYPTYDPSQKAYMGIAAQLMAEDIKHVYGGEGWNDSLWISFDYVGYTSDNVETIRYHQEWNRLTDEALLSGKLDDGRPFEVHFTSLSKREGTMLVDSTLIPKTYLSASLNTAYNQFMYNTRWLLLPVELVDSGVVLERLKDTVLSNMRLITLKVSFEEDSAAPDTYFILYVNPQFRNIERWSVHYNGSSKDYIWRLYRRVDPFLISTKRYTEDFKSYIRFENIQIRKLDKDTIAAMAREKEEKVSEGKEQSTNE